MKKQFVLLTVLVLLFAVAATSAMVINNKSCTAENKPKEVPMHDMLMPGPVNFFQL
ncbi:MAG TPA: hypothetical protein VK173_12510 [Lacibacter sp.]|jgi:hypothetical protein|nr:hypothetical protein [Lacibacter sp.]